MINTCNGNIMTTASGLQFDFSDPQPDQVDIEDIAQALGNTCRWGGHCRFYSVAEHSVLASDLVLSDHPYDYVFRLAVLLHDATEAYIGDMPKPLKIMLSQYNDIEDRLEDIIIKKYCPYSVHEEDIKYYDVQMFKREREVLFDDTHIGPALKEVPTGDIDLEFWTPEEAKWAFLNMYDELRGRLTHYDEE